MDADENVARYNGHPEKGSSSTEEVKPGDGQAPLSSKLYRSIEGETTEPTDANVIGKVPAWLKGNLFRNGPGMFEVGPDKMDHLFDGLAFLHRFIIHEGGRIQYQGRFLRSDMYAAALKHQRLTFGGFGTMARHPDPCKTLFQRLLSLFKLEFPDNCNVNWMKLGDDYFVMTETPKLKKIDVDSLDVLDTVRIDNLLGVHTATAHPHTTRDGTTYNMGTAMSMRCRYSIIQIPPCPKGSDPWDSASILTSIPSSTYCPSYFHSFGLTDNYIIFLEQPLRINTLKALTSKLTGQPLTECMQFCKEEKARFYLIRRADGHVFPTHYTADAFFCFHHINAFEDGRGHVAVDMCCYADDGILRRVTMANMLSNGLHTHDSRPLRYVLPLVQEEQAGSLAEKARQNGGSLVTMAGSRATATLNDDGSIYCHPEPLADVGLEAPAINYKEYNGRRYQYAYGVGGSTQDLHKIDLETGTVSTWSSPGCFPSEPVFVPSPTSSAEDDGVILSCVLDLEHEGKRPYLLILDARSFTEIARAEVTEKTKTFGFHGMFSAGD
ncbi:carotenoid-cleaving dioxygenase, mitochondrial-like [Diadema setosum]|uniref:carotenoid-cleaving dioxygenase, mitochondrial-like n=1 Tax=Diadema setosum TaxID=31175 RepID=UPI003B3B55AA